MIVIKLVLATVAALTSKQNDIKIYAYIIQEMDKRL